jgi:hypothetical protein
MADNARIGEHEIGGRDTGLCACMGRITGLLGLCDRLKVHSVRQPEHLFVGHPPAYVGNDTHGLACYKG